MNHVIVVLPDTFQVRPQALLDIHPATLHRRCEVGMLQLDLIPEEALVLPRTMLERGIEFGQPAQQLRFVDHQLVFPFLPPVHPMRAYVFQLADFVLNLKAIRSHWVDWRQEWEHKLVVNETKLLRGLAELNAAFQHRAGLTESFFRDQVKLQHADFTAAVERSGVDIQKRLWADLERIR